MDLAATVIVSTTMPNQEDLINKLEHLEANYELQARFHFAGRPILHVEQEKGNLPNQTAMNTTPKRTLLQKISATFCAPFDSPTNEGSFMANFRQIKPKVEPKMHSEDDAVNIRMAPFVRDVEKIFTTTIAYTPLISLLFSVIAGSLELTNQKSSATVGDLNETFNSTVGNLTQALEPYLQCSNSMTG